MINEELEELKATLEWLKTCGNNDYIFETGNSRILLVYITNLQQENNKLVEIVKDYKSRKEKAVEYIEKFIPVDNNIILMSEKQRDYLLNILNVRSDE